MCLLGHLHIFSPRPRRAIGSKREMAIPEMELIIGSPDCGRKGPTAEQRSGVDMLSRVLTFGEPLHGKPVPREWGTQRDEPQSSSLSVGDLQQDSRLPGRLASTGKTQGPFSASIDWHPDEARLAPTIASRGCSSEALLSIRQRRLLNSNNTCYLNAVVLSWLHAITQTGCTEHAAFGCRTQAWRDVLYSHKAIHAHALPSWQGILEGWADVHRQHDAGEMLEHWVAAGRPQVVSGRWEARIAERGLVEIRRYAETSSPINVEFHESAQVVSLQQLILEWHVNQSLVEKPQILMLLLMRFKPAKIQHLLPSQPRCRSLCLMTHHCSAHLHPTECQPF